MSEPRCLRPTRLLAPLLALVVLGAHAAAADAALTARATNGHGWIGLRLAHGTARSTAAVTEGSHVIAQVPVNARGRATAARLARWRCTSQLRRLAVADGAAGTVRLEVRTPSCRDRLDVRVAPRRHLAGAMLRVEIHDRWDIGQLAPHVCLATATATWRCVTVAMSHDGATVRLRAPRPGRWWLRLRAPGLAMTRRLSVLPGDGARLQVLAAGDSLMELVAQELPGMLAPWGAEVRGDVVFGAGLSDQHVANWRVRSRRTARAWRPDVVVAFLGGADGFPIGTTSCCGAAWRAAYGARARVVSRRYARGGAAQVYWLTLPAPENARQAEAWRAENDARAAGLPALAPWVHQIDTVELLSPGFVYRASMPIDGRETVIRTADGMHLTRPGAHLVAEQVVAALAADGILR